MHIKNNIEKDVDLPKTWDMESLDWTQLMVKIRSLEFSYDRKSKFINELNMSVPKGAIYGLLGPSGCGKTTVLKLILGLLRPTFGKIRINGKISNHPDNNIPGIGVGFMPQELSLIQEFTVYETLKYFSKLYGMSRELTLSRIQFLVEFLNLPDPNSLITNMSGGQKRRVSLSLCLIHRPPLLILDEPTVGTDPIIREKIWRHLMFLSQRKSTTIIITTHYIEEARRAHVISLMRKGELLVEHSPQYLLNHFQTENLEKINMESKEKALQSMSSEDHSIYGALIIDTDFTAALMRRFTTDLRIVLSNIYFMTMGITAVMFVLESNSGLLERSLLTGLKMRFAISSTMKEVQWVSMVTTSTCMIYLYLSGFIWPLHGMPVLMRRLSLVMPLTLPLKALRDMLNKGLSFGDQSVDLGKGLRY
ncbi:unnamed protein product [Oppiella nova]|uniref:ABC transporter domain-containing protein n=1 Tax=Oppiella nova TaxID=334625 RepID=A0A7R9LEV1_9ACAR|nr:unnamed protein product [Oppiella nova]CAG2162434.1 unnamed protein product [Oppiella nova]